MLDNIFIKIELKQYKCEIEITDRIWELNEIKGADMFIKFRAWFRLLRLRWISNLNCVKFTTFIHILDKRKLTMKKIFKICMPFILFIVITSCNQGRIKELENQVSELESQLSEKQNELDEFDNKLSEIHGYIGDLESTISQLRSEVDDFSYEDWQYNVPDVEDATSNVESAFDDLQSNAY